MEGVRLSVVICTRNRANLLDRTLTSLAEQSASSVLEVVVVDNGSADETPQILAAWCASGTLQLKVAIEPRKGYYALARNAGLAHVIGPVVAFVDDDVTIPSQWAASIIQVFDSMPKVDGLAGPVDGEWECVPPPWLNREMLFAVSVGHFGPAPRWLTRKEYPIGANMAFRTHVLREAGGFDSRLGRVGEESFYYDEVELVDRLRALGKQIYYDPAVQLVHFVPEARSSPDYFLERRRNDGRSIAFCDSLRGGKPLVIRNALLRLGLAMLRDFPGYLVTSAWRTNDHLTYRSRLVKVASYLRQTKKIVLDGRTDAGNALGSGVNIRRGD